LQVSKAFHRWIRASQRELFLESSVSLRVRVRNANLIKTCFSALRHHGQGRVHLRDTLKTLESTAARARLQRLWRGWVALSWGLAAATVRRQWEWRLGEERQRAAGVAAGVRCRGHRTARRLLGLARGRLVLEVFVAWKALVRSGRGSRMGARVLLER
ncbi:unnamed protein product, partial [Choristocarpus tenellus]